MIRTSRELKRSTEEDDYEFNTLVVQDLVLSAVVFAIAYQVYYALDLKIPFFNLENALIFIFSSGIVSSIYAYFEGFTFFIVLILSIIGVAGYNYTR